MKWYFWVIIAIVVIIIISYFVWKNQTKGNNKCTYQRTYYPCGIPGCENVTETVESIIVDGKCLEKEFTNIP